MKTLEVQNNVVDLDKYRNPGTLVLSGRPKGEALRKQLGLDMKDQQLGIITVLVPQEIISLNSSFMLGLFADSIRKLGIEGFEKKYIFECGPEVLEDIERAKKEAINESNPLPQR